MVKLQTLGMVLFPEMDLFFTQQCFQLLLQLAHTLCVISKEIPAPSQTEISKQTSRQPPSQLTAVQQFFQFLWSKADVGQVVNFFWRIPEGHRH